MNTHGSRPLRSYVVPGAILLVAFGLRVYRLGAQSLWYDEAFGIHLANLPIGEATRSMASTFNPPLYYYLLRFWIPAAGASEFSVRMASVYAGILILPLGYSIAKFMYGRAAGLFTMLFFAISPLYVWHSQNARMYTLLTVAVLVSIWALLRILDDMQRSAHELGRGRWWWLWGLCLGATIYIHTVGVYPVVAQMLILTFFAWRQGRLRAILRRALGIGLALTVIYAPWLWLVVREYKVDFYPGTLSPLVVITSAFRAFATGDTLSEPIASLATAAGLALLVMAVLTLISSREKAGDSRTSHPAAASLFLLLMTFVPLLIMALALYRIPKFTPRYTIAASPTFFLLLAAGSASWVQLRRRTLAVTGLTILLGISLVGTLLVFTDLRKDDFRSVARYVESHIAPDETVLLLSGHAFPAWGFYYSGEWSPVPDLEVIDLNRTVDYSVANTLNSALEDKRGVWVVRWQDQIIDPNGFVQMMLDQAGQLQPTPDDFSGMEMWHYRWDTLPNFSDRPDIAQPLEVTFGPIELLGYTQDPDALTLFWQATSKPEHDFKVALRLHDGQFVWGESDRWPSTHLYPTRFWKSGEVLFGRGTIPVSPGTPPGQYLISLSLYDEQNLQAVYASDAAGQTLGVWATFPVTLARTWRSHDIPQDLAHRLDTQLNDEITLLGYDLDVQGVPSGGPLHLELYWQAHHAPTTDYAVRVEWATVEGITIADVAYPLAAQHPSREWAAGEFVRGHYAVPSPPASGPFDLCIQLSDESGFWASEYVSLRSVIVPSLP